MTFVVICIPTKGTVTHHHALTLASIVTSLTQDRIGFAMNYGQASMGAAHSRNLCLENMFEQEKAGLKVDYLFWWDDDVIIPSRTIQALISHDKDMVAASYRRRTGAKELMAIIKPRPGDLVGGHVDVSGLLQAEKLPMGCMLMKRKVLDGMKMPVFQMPPNYDVGKLTGEDYHFCEQARANGHELWLDADLSGLTGHIGEDVLWTERIEKESPLLMPPKVPSLIGLGALNGRGH